MRTDGFLRRGSIGGGSERSQRSRWRRAFASAAARPPCFPSEKNACTWRLRRRIRTHQPRVRPNSKRVTFISLAMALSFRRSSKEQQLPRRRAALERALRLGGLCERPLAADADRERAAPDPCEHVAR